VEPTPARAAAVPEEERVPDDERAASNAVAGKAQSAAVTVATAAA